MENWLRRNVEESNNSPPVLKEGKGANALKYTLGAHKVYGKEKKGGVEGLGGAVEGISHGKDGSAVLGLRLSVGGVE